MQTLRFEPLELYSNPIQVSYKSSSKISECIELFARFMLSFNSNNWNHSQLLRVSLKLVTSDLNILYDSSLLLASV